MAGRGQGAATAAALLRWAWPPPPAGWAHATTTAQADAQEAHARFMGEHASAVTLAFSAALTDVQACITVYVADRLSDPAAAQMYLDVEQRITTLHAKLQELTHGLQAHEMEMASAVTAQAQGGGVASTNGTLPAGGNANMSPSTDALDSGAEEGDDGSSRAHTESKEGEVTTPARAPRRGKGTRTRRHRSPPPPPPPPPATTGAGGMNESDATAAVGGAATASSARVPVAAMLGAVGGDGAPPALDPDMERLLTAGTATGDRAELRQLVVDTRRAMIAMARAFDEEKAAWSTNHEHALSALALAFQKDASPTRRDAAAGGDGEEGVAGPSATAGHGGYHPSPSWTVPAPVAARLQRERDQARADCAALMQAVERFVAMAQHSPLLPADAKAALQAYLVDMQQALPGTAHPVDDGSEDLDEVYWLSPPPPPSSDGVGAGLEVEEVAGGHGARGGQPASDNAPSSIRSITSALAAVARDLATGGLNAATANLYHPTSGGHASTPHPAPLPPSRLIAHLAPVDHVAAGGGTTKPPQPPVTATAPAPTTTVAPVPAPIATLPTAHSSSMLSSSMLRLQMSALAMTFDNLSKRLAPTTDTAMALAVTTPGTTASTAGRTSPIASPASVSTQTHEAPPAQRTMVSGGGAPAGRLRVEEKSMLDSSMRTIHSTIASLSRRASVGAAARGVGLDADGGEEGHGEALPADHPAHVALQMVEERVVELTGQLRSERLVHEEQAASWRAEVQRLHGELEACRQRAAAAEALTTHAKHRQAEVTAQLVAVQAGRDAAGAQASSAAESRALVAALTEKVRSLSEELVRAQAATAAATASRTAAGHDGHPTRQPPPPPSTVPVEEGPMTARGEMALLNARLADMRRAVGHTPATTTAATLAAAITASAQSIMSGSVSSTLTTALTSDATGVATIIHGIRRPIPSASVDVPLSPTTLRASLPFSGHAGADEVAAMRHELVSHAARRLGWCVVSPVAHLAMPPTATAPTAGAGADPDAAGRSLEDGGAMAARVASLQAQVEDAQVAAAEQGVVVEAMRMDVASATAALRNTERLLVEAKGELSAMQEERDTAHRDVMALREMMKSLGSHDEVRRQAAATHERLMLAEAALLASSQEVTRLTAALARAEGAKPVVGEGEPGGVGMRTQNEVGRLTAEVQSLRRQVSVVEGDKLRAADAHAASMAAVATVINHVFGTTFDGAALSTPAGLRTLEVALRQRVTAASSTAGNAVVELQAQLRHTTAQLRAVALQKGALAKELAQVYGAVEVLQTHATRLEMDNAALNGSRMAAGEETRGPTPTSSRLRRGVGEGLGPPGPLLPAVDAGFEHSFVNAVAGSEGALAPPPFNTGSVAGSWRGPAAGHGHAGWGGITPAPPNLRSVTPGSGRMDGGGGDGMGGSSNGSGRAPPTATLSKPPSLSGSWGPMAMTRSIPTTGLGSSGMMGGSLRRDMMG